ncbi:ATP-binding cassette, subfamily C (CFTR/MRP), member 12 [Sarotherodon galilaeus]
MKKAQSASSPAKIETPSSKRCRPADSPGTTSPAGKDITDILESIDKRLSSFDARLSLVEILHREFKSLRESLEFSQQQVETLVAENATLRESVKSLTDNVTQLNIENKKIKESVIDLQARSMRDNLVFSGIPESAGEDAEATVKSFIKTHLKLPEDTVKNIAFERVADRETTSNCGQIRPIQTEGTGEESRQGAERNGLQRERPVPQRDPGTTQGPVPSST